jgi:periplasmic protein TonB
VTDASLVHPRVESMSLTAIGLAVLVHAAVGVAIWWLSPLKPGEPQDEPIMVSFDSSPSNVGLQEPERAGPPAESVAASPSPATEATGQEQQQAMAQPSTAQPQPEPVPNLPIYEFSIPPVPEPPPAPTSRDFPRPYSAPPARPVQRTPPTRPLPPAQQRPAAEAPASIPAPLPGPNPADVFVGQGRQRNDYLSRLHRYLAPYRDRSHRAHGANQTGQVVTRVTLARDGSVLNVNLASSSGRPAIDAAELEAIRNAAPFPPLPANMPGDPVVLVLRTTY